MQQLIDRASSETDERVEPQPLWEYPTKALGFAKTLLEINIENGIPDSVVSQDVTLPIEGCGTLHGLALWVDWHYDPSFIDGSLTTGALTPPELEEKVTVLMSLHTLFKGL